MAADLKARFARSDAAPLIVAHRGGSLEAPENTLAALRHAIACGSDWQEIDVTLSRDGHPVVIHDDTLERTTAAQGAVADRDLRELTALGAGTPKWTQRSQQTLASAGVTALPTFGSRYADECIPTLDAALALQGAQLMLELKATPAPERLAEAVIQAVYRAGMRNRVALGSLDVASVAAVKKLDPSLPRIGIIEHDSTLSAQLALGVAALAVDTALAPRLIAEKPADVALWTWTIYTPAAANQMLRYGADGLITDVPAAVATALRSGGAPVPPVRRG